MPLASSCGDPNPVPNARLSFTATRQGDVAVVQCHASFVQSPREVSMETKCQVCACVCVCVRARVCVCVCVCVCACVWSSVV